MFIHEKRIKFAFQLNVKFHMFNEYPHEKVEIYMHLKVSYEIIK
jgi:hypothetical protein